MLIPSFYTTNHINVHKFISNGRRWAIWTPDHLIPNQVRYQTALISDNKDSFINVSNWQGLTETPQGDKIEPIPHYKVELKWWTGWGSNSRPMACKAIALPTELPAHYDCFGFIGKRSTVFLLKIQLLTLGLRESNNHPSILWQEKIDSNNHYRFWRPGFYPWTIFLWWAIKHSKLACLSTAVLQTVPMPLWSLTHKMNVLWSNIQHHFVL